MNVPGLEFVKIDVSDDIEVDFLGGDFLGEVIVEELLLGGVETEPGRDLGVSIDGQIHVLWRHDHMVN